MEVSTVTGRIDAILKEKGISKQEFYTECGISSAAYSQWNTGKTVPRAKRLQIIANYLQVNVEYLVTGLGEKEKAPTSEGERPITFDDFTYAMQDEAKDLTEMDKQLLLSMARQLNDARKKRDGESG